MRRAQQMRVEWSWILRNIPSIGGMFTRAGQAWWRELNRLTRRRFIGWDTQAGRGHNLVGREILNIRGGAGENGRRERTRHIQSILALVRRIGMRRRRKRGYVIMINGVKIRFKTPPPPPPPPWPPPMNTYYQSSTTPREEDKAVIDKERGRYISDQYKTKRNNKSLIIRLTAASSGESHCGGQQA
jgi:hypothetical protein